MIQISGKKAHLAQKRWFYEKLPTSKVENFLKLKFNLNQIFKLVITQNHKIGMLTQLTFFIFLLKIGETL